MLNIKDGPEQKILNLKQKPHFPKTLKENTLEKR